MTWIGVNTFQKFNLRQLRHWVFFCAIWPLHLGTLRKLHTKHWIVLSSSMQHLFGIHIMTQIGQVEKVQRTAARWTCRRWRNTSSVGDMLDELEWPSLETRRDQSSLTFFYKIHSGTVSLDKDKYLTPAPNLRRKRASHESQHTRYLAYSDALKNSFSPGLSLCGIVFPLQWSHLRPYRSLRLRFRLLIQRYVF